MILMLFTAVNVARQFQRNLDAKENFMLPANLPVLSDQQKAVLLQKMMAEVDCLLHETDNFWQDPENIAGYLYQAWVGLVPVEEIALAIESHLSTKTKY